MSARVFVYFGLIDESIVDETDMSKTKGSSTASRGVAGGWFAVLLNLMPRRGSWQVPIWMTCSSHLSP